MKKQSLNIKDAWSYATRCRHCGWREVYVVDKTHMSYRAFYRQVTEQLVRIGLCHGCEEKGVHDLAAICQENYSTPALQKRNGQDAIPDPQPLELPVAGNEELVSGQ